jgi:hypothetical protein
MQSGSIDHVALDVELQDQVPIVLQLDCFPQGAAYFHQ